MGTMISLIADGLVGGNALDPDIIDFVRDRQQLGVSFEFNMVVDCQFISRRNRKIEQFDKPVRESALHG
uniref:Uncharacterized protein n=1 Tax=Romanomermis culicivorax TaxID=13658 RepID=A0A915K2B2_ROMCU